ncbi:hypothetical protein ABZ942_20710 [Nocardia sp. NPDC046473]|uniref:hypothetical protein n=1 Tax=Nocardia sp. NPDC046473 TaxID=3155733 RepID=UPI0033EF7BF0
MPAASEFYVEAVFPVSFRATPFVVGRAVGDFTVGQEVELHKKDGSVHRGVMEGLDFHRPGPDKFSLVFSAEVSTQVEPGDVIYSSPPEQ